MVLVIALILIAAAAFGLALAIRSDARKPPVKIPAIVSRDSAALPKKAYLGDGAADIHAAEEATISPGGRALVSGGFKIALPQGYAALVLPRSGLALKNGITVLNAPGLVDAGYRGEVGVVLQNHGAEPFTVAVGDRIAQLMVVPVIDWTLAKTTSLPGSERGEGGFGSSGVASLTDVGADEKDR